MSDVLNEAFSEAVEAAAPTTQENVQAAPAPAQQADPEPAAAAQPAPTTTEKPEAVEFAKEVMGQNREYLAGLQHVIEQQKALMEHLLQKNKPELTPEQREEQIQKAFAQLNADPEAFINSRVQEKLQQELEKLKANFAPRNPASEQLETVQSMVSRLHMDSRGNVLRPELGDQEFLRRMVSPEVQKAVFDTFYKGSRPEDLIKDPGFYADLYHHTKAVLAAEKTASQSQEDMNAQRQVIAGHGSAAATGKSGAGSSKVSPEDAFKQEMLGAQSPSSKIFDGAKWERSNR